MFCCGSEEPGRGESHPCSHSVTGLHLLQFPVAAEVHDLNSLEGRGDPKPKWGMAQLASLQSVHDRPPQSMRKWTELFFSQKMSSQTKKKF